jgi:hypothetical protein
MRRLYFLVEDIDCVRKVVEGLLLARIEERHIHVIAKEGVALQELPEASLLQKSDFVPAVERGIAIGGATGLLAGLVAMAVPGGLVLGGGALLATGLLGVGVGAWLSGMIGMDAPNSRLKQFEKSIEKGELLVLVDVPKDRVQEIESLIKKQYEKAEVEGTEPTIPAFP